MRRFGDSHLVQKEQLALVFALAFSLILLFSNDAAQVHTLRTWTIAGVGLVLEKVSTLESLIGVREENERLRQVNAELMLENSRMREAMLENQRLRSMLAFKSESEFDLLPANVIGKESSGPLRALLVSAGKNHGAEKDLAVVTSTGLLGKVFAALPDYSIVQLMTDRNFRVGALVRRSRVLGIVKWQEANIALLTEVPKRSDITTGDEVITSGQSLIFPGGIHIGKVIDVIDDEQEMFMEVKLQLATDSQIAEEVFVVKNRPVPFQ